MDSGMAVRASVAYSLYSYCERSLYRLLSLNILSSMGSFFKRSKKQFT